jgi:hypothetical protein
MTIIFQYFIFLEYDFAKKKQGKNHFLKNIFYTFYQYHRTENPNPDLIYLTLS